jgi:hypothetical protein
VLGVEQAVSAAHRVVSSMRPVVWRSSLL